MFSNHKTFGEISLEAIFKSYWQKVIKVAKIRKSYTHIISINQLFSILNLTKFAATSIYKCVIIFIKSSLLLDRKNSLFIKCAYKFNQGRLFWPYVSMCVCMLGWWVRLVISYSNVSSLTIYGSRAGQCIRNKNNKT